MGDEKSAKGAGERPDEGAAAANPAAANERADAIDAATDGDGVAKLDLGGGGDGE